MNNLLEVYNPTDDELDSIRLGIMRMLFNPDWKFTSARFENEGNGDKTMRLTFSPMEGDF